MSVFYMDVGKILQQANTLPTRWIKVHKKYVLLSAAMRTAKKACGAIYKNLAKRSTDATDKTEDFKIH